MARELEEFLKRTADASNSGIPPGFGGVGGVGGGSSQAGNGVQDVFADATPSAGTENMGWAAVDHQHNALTGSAEDLTQQASSEGTGAALARADHLHQMRVWLASLSDCLKGHWKMNETSGTRANEIPGTATNFSGGGLFHTSYTGPSTGLSTDLFEQHGTVSGEAGHFGNAFRPVIDPSDLDYRSYGLWLRSPAYVNWFPLGDTPGVPLGGTIAIIFKPETGIAATGGHSIGGLANFNTFPYAMLSLSSQFDGGVLKVRALTTTTPGTSVQYTGFTQECTLDAWHIAFAWYDATDNSLHCQLDDGAPVSVSLGANLPLYDSYTYWITGPRFTGLIDNSWLWSRLLSASERAYMFNGGAFIDDLPSPNLVNVLDFRDGLDVSFESSCVERAVISASPLWAIIFGGD